MNDVPFSTKIITAWNNAAPDWIIELAALADQLALKGAGKRIGYTGSLVSTVLANKYTGDLKAVEGAVRGALMGLTVYCLAQGDITKDVCLAWQKLPRGQSDSTRVRVYRACRSGCLHSRISQKKEQANARAS